MKQVIQNNPHEARQMLIQNPQLAYALLQAQVVMRIIDPATAVSFLFKPNIVRLELFFLICSSIIIIELSGERECSEFSLFKYSNLK